MLMMEPGTKNGEMRRGPLAPISRMLSSIIGSPPMPEPTITPVRSAFDVVDREPGIVERQLRGRDAEVDERVGAARLLGRHPLRRVEALHLGGDAGRQERGVELRDRADAAHAVDEVVPGLRDADADGGYDPKAGDDDAAFGHGVAPGSRGRGLRGGGRRRGPRGCGAGPRAPIA